MSVVMIEELADRANGLLKVSLFGASISSVLNWEKVSDKETILM